MRASSFSNEDVIRLANRRFVNFVYDINGGVGVGDPEAEAFVKKLGGGGFMNLRFATPDGELLASLPAGAKEGGEKTLKTMLELLRDHPEFAKPSELEKSVSNYEKALIQTELHNFSAAKRLATGINSDGAALLLARLARFEQDWPEMMIQLALIHGKGRLDDVRMEMARYHWEQNDYKQLLEMVSGISGTDDRYSEAAYFKGLAYYHLEDKEKALQVWKDLVDSQPQDSWVYRADFAHSGVLKPDPSGGGSTADPTSVIGRTGYIGDSNKDLLPR